VDNEQAARKKQPPMTASARNAASPPIVREMIPVRRIRLPPLEWVSGLTPDRFASVCVQRPFNASAESCVKSEFRVSRQPPTLPV